jgi:hypothetical protein
LWLPLAVGSTQGHTSVPQVGFELMLPVFERANIVHGLDLLANVIRNDYFYYYWYYWYYLYYYCYYYWYWYYLYYYCYYFWYSYYLYYYCYYLYYWYWYYLYYY